MPWVWYGGAVMKKPSQKQQQILEFLRQYLDEYRYPPSVRDIQKGCNISSTSVVDYNIRALQRLGYVRRSPDVSRGIELLGDTRNALLGSVPVPLLGTIAAGSPIPVPDTGSWEGMAPLEILQLPESLVGRRQSAFALRVRGLSMIDALIDDGDIVILEPVLERNNGDMLAVWLKLEQEVTLKYVFDEGARIRLQPANIQMEPMFTSPNNVDIQGRVVGVLRNLR